MRGGRWDTPHHARQATCRGGPHGGGVYERFGKSVNKCICRLDCLKFFAERGLWHLRRQNHIESESGETDLNSIRSEKRIASTIHSPQTTDP